MRIAQHRAPAESQPEALRALIDERANDPEFDRETIELMLRAGEPEAWTALARRVGGIGDGVCSFAAVSLVERTRNEVSFVIGTHLSEAADHLCKLGCEVTYR